jgi:hypothetical protein
LTCRGQDAILLEMKKTLVHFLAVALLVGAGFLQPINATEIHPTSLCLLQAAMSSDPIVGTYDSTRYGTTFNFQEDGTILGADGLGDGTWHTVDSAHHTYMVKIRPSILNSPDRYESWTLVLEKGGLTQNGGQTIVFGRMK